MVIDLSLNKDGEKITITSEEGNYLVNKFDYFEWIDTLKNRRDKIHIGVSGLEKEVIKQFVEQNPQYKSVTDFVRKIILKEIDFKEFADMSKKDEPPEQARFRSLFDVRKKIKKTVKDISTRRFKLGRSIHGMIEEAGFKINSTDLLQGIADDLSSLVVKVSIFEKNHEQEVIELERLREENRVKKGKKELKTE